MPLAITKKVSFVTHTTCHNSDIKAPAVNNTSITVYDDFNKITSEVINKLLMSQKVSITQSELDKLKTIPGVKFDLPFNDETYSIFVSLVGTPRTRLRKPGVYIFTHKATGRKYVGSSNSLSRRLNQYFKESHFNQSNAGLLIPLIKYLGFSAFELEIRVMPSEINSDFYFLFLEQYLLLHKSFDLNSQRIVNFRVSQGTTIYLYSIDGKILYYISKSLNEMSDNLGIHHATSIKGIKRSETYLNFFKITDTPIENAENACLDLPDLIKLISDKKAQFLKRNFSTRLSVPIFIKNVANGEIVKFDSIKSTVSYFKSKNIVVDRNKISKCLISGDQYKGYIFSKA